MDTVLPVEKGLDRKRGSNSRLDEPIKRDANVRKSGEDFQKDELILSKGTMINDHHKIALIMNQKNTIQVFQIPRLES